MKMLSTIFHKDFFIDFKNGKIYHKIITKKKTKKEIGSYDNGYKRIMYQKKSYRFHRFIMSQYLGRELDKEEIVDHINGVKDDNRIENLRVVNRNQNCQNLKGPQKNNKSTGVLGIIFREKNYKSKKKYIANISANGKFLYYKAFYTLKEAIQARNEKVKELNSNGHCYRFSCEKPDNFGIISEEIKDALLGLLGLP